MSEEGTISSNPTTVDAALQSGLLGMITIADILHQLIQNQPPVVSGKQKYQQQVQPYSHLNNTKATVCEPSMIINGDIKAVN
jgi:hypothetical protein